MAPEAAVAEEERLRAEREVRKMFRRVSFFRFGGDGVEVDDVVVVVVVGPLCSSHHSPALSQLTTTTINNNKNNTPQQQQAAAAAASNANPLTEATLSKSRAAELDKLLNQTDLYTKFLSEQMESIEQKTEAEAAAEAAAAAAAAGGQGGKKGKKAGGKGGAAGARGGSAGPAGTAAAAAADAEKKRKRSADGLSPTQELLPLIEGELRDYQLRGKGCRDSFDLEGVEESLKPVVRILRKKRARKNH